MPPRLAPHLLVTIWQLQTSNRFLQSEIHGFVMSLPVDRIQSKGRRSIVFSVCQLPNPIHFLPGIRHIVFINTGCASRCWVCKSGQSLELARWHVNNFASLIFILFIKSKHLYYLYSLETHWFLLKGTNLLPLSHTWLKDIVILTLSVCLPICPSTNQHYHSN